ncbi:hypothetical protein B9Q01_09410 [Candidatus Marsarchaeota G1 archaeon OSP_D]|jgi:branched-chain amino acid transport system permease protein|uniref:Branched-chain amino acid ABC transporter permease n=2 Tax=Candidatus Marsarchaeota group 1 TaxID=2203770 RepID=A0A2R6AI83_9ARCH|nr:MAG: hypothetical protein B9Q01_09410 [Candidatus Marsarchaeota G1 archaeon OSP_D]PSN86095.1 MAG: hypothetical protein B9Q02_03710 [Candidatus Marsarchaeota G1 archaeon BE_D]
MDLLLVIIQAILNGLLLGGIYGIISVGLTLIFGVMKIANFAHGELMMLAMYFTYFFVLFTSLNPLFSLVLSVPTLFVIGYGIESQLLHRVLPKGENPVILITIGLSIFLSNLAEVLWSPNYLVVPISYPNTVYKILGLVFQESYLIIFAGSIITVVSLWIFLTKTKTGIMMRATAQDPFAASLMGINPDKIFPLAFGLGASLTAVGGSLLAPLYPIFPTIGSYFVLLMFITVVVGGLGSIWGTFAGGIIISVVLSISSVFFTGDIATVILFVFFLIVLLFRPRGIFGKSVRIG